MSELPSDDRKLIYMRYFENKTQSDTAKTLGMTQVQVSRREKKLLGQMREVLLR
jgi:RNA polymerase sporulation-specific sigma factor